MEPIEINKRATFFLVESLLLDIEKIQTIAEFFSGVLDLMPVSNKRIQMKITPSGVVTSSEEKGIEMKRVDDSLRVTFDSNRVDVFSTQSQSMREFLDVIRVIKETLNRLEVGLYARFALCHQMYYICTEEQFDKCYRATFCNADKPSIEWNAQRVIREKFSDESLLMMNNIIFIGRVLNANVDGNLINEKLLLNIDVNTVPNSDITEINNNVDGFFERAMQIIEDDERLINDIFAK